MAGNFFGGPFFGGGFFGANAGPTITVIYGAGGDTPTWKDHVKAVADRRTAQYALRAEEKKLATVKRKIVKAVQQVKKAEKPDGILANLWRLEERKAVIEEKVQILEAKIAPLDWFIESFRNSEEIDDDDEEILFH